jgi:hypothetical protein
VQRTVEPRNHERQGREARVRERRCAHDSWVKARKRHRATLGEGERIVVRGLSDPERCVRERGPFTIPRRLEGARRIHHENVRPRSLVTRRRCLVTCDTVANRCVCTGVRVGGQSCSCSWRRLGLGSRGGGASARVRVPRRLTRVSLGSLLLAGTDRLGAAVLGEAREAVRASYVGGASALVALLRGGRGCGKRAAATRLRTRRGRRCWRSRRRQSGRGRNTRGRSRRRHGC